MASIHIYLFQNPLYTENPRKGTLENSKDPDEMENNAAFHPGLHCLVRQKPSSEKETEYTEYFWKF